MSRVETTAVALTEWLETRVVGPNSSSTSELQPKAMLLGLLFVHPGETQPPQTVRRDASSAAS